FPQASGLRRAPLSRRDGASPLEARETRTPPLRNTKRRPNPVGRKPPALHARPRVASHALENVLPVLSSPSARNVAAPLGLKVKRKFGSSAMEMPPSIEK